MAFCLSMRQILVSAALPIFMTMDACIEGDDYVSNDVGNAQLLQVGTAMHGGKAVRNDSKADRNDMAATYYYVERSLVAAEGNSVGDFTNPAVSLEECKSQCDSKSTCKSFSFKLSFGACHLKDKQVSDGDTASGNAWGYKTYFQQVELKDVFERIAKDRAWNSAETVSGSGSELNMTSKVRKCLGDWIKKYNVKVFMDIPCGDANWQGHIPGIDSITYKGYDIAEEAVKLARVKNAQHPNMSFGSFDLTSQVPQVKSDILLVRDVIQHLSLEEGTAFLTHAKASGARYLAVTTWNGEGRNVEINSGSFFKDDIHAPPFNLPQPLETCDNDDFQYWGHDKLELIDLSV